MKRCESCGRFVPRNHLRTVRRYYDIDPTAPVAVYSIATATKLQQRLDCRDCSMPCCLMREAQRDQGIAVGSSLPGGWEPCPQSATQRDYALRSQPDTS